MRKNFVHIFECDLQRSFDAHLKMAIGFPYENRFFKKK